MKWMLIEVLFLSFGGLTVVHADTLFGTITQLRGTALVLLGETSQLETLAAPRLKYRSKYYSYHSAIPGDEIKEGSVIITRNESMVKITSPLGDEFFLASNSEIRTSDPKKMKTIDIHYGKIRGIVEKKKKGLKYKIQTSAVAMGVRGTDFIFSNDPSLGKTKILLKEGEVDISSRLGSQSSITLKTDEAIEFNAATPSKELLKRRMTSEEKKEVIRMDDVKLSEVSPSEEARGRIEALEKKAHEIHKLDLGDLEKVD